MELSSESKNPWTKRMELSYEIENRPTECNDLLAESMGISSESKNPRTKRNELWTEWMELSDEIYIFTVYSC